MTNKTNIDVDLIDSIKVIPYATNHLLSVFCCLYSETPDTEGGVETVP